MPVFIVAIVVAVVGGGYYFFTSQKPAAAPTPSPVTQTAPAPVAPVAPTAAMKKKYFDGQYSAEGSYLIPNNENEKITVSLTLKDGMITAADFTGNPVEKGSVYNQGKFREAFKPLVVGKKIDEVALSIVNGASLTGKGFMMALNEIKVKAQTAPVTTGA